MTNNSGRLTNEELLATAHGFEAETYRKAFDIEVSASRDLLLAASAETCRRVGAEVRQVGQSVMFVAPGVQQIMFNRAQICAPSGELAVDELDSIVAGFAKAGVTSFLLQLDPRIPEPHARELLAERGVKPYRRPWVKLARHNTSPPAVSTDFEIREARTEDAHLVADLMREGFGFPEEAKAFYGGTVGRPGWRAYLAWQGFEAAGLGIAYQEGRLCYLAGGVTLARFRRRSVQRVLMQRRIVDAIAAGATTITTETGLPLASEENPSYRNMIHLGFRAVGTRHNFGPEGTKW